MRMHVFSLSSLFVFLSLSSAIKLGDKEVEYNPSFRLILHTKLANPHYKPEMQAQTTLINFTVTRDGLGSLCIFILAHIHQIQRVAE